MIQASTFYQGLTGVSPCFYVSVKVAIHTCRVVCTILSNDEKYLVHSSCDCCCNELIDAIGIVLIENGNWNEKDYSQISHENNNTWTRWILFSGYFLLPILCERLLWAQLCQPPTSHIPIFCYRNITLSIFTQYSKWGYLIIFFCMTMSIQIVSSSTLPDNLS